MDLLKHNAIATDAHFVYAAPKSMTIAVFSPPLTKPSNKGIVPNSSGKKMPIVSVDNSKFASYEMDKKICCLPVGLGWVLRDKMTSRQGAWSKRHFSWTFQKGTI